MKTGLKLLLYGGMIAGVGAGLGAEPHVEAELRIDKVEHAAGGVLMVTFTDTGTGAAGYRVETARGFGADTIWEPAPGAVIVPLAMGRHRVILPEPAGGAGFFRVIAHGTDGEVVLVNFLTTAMRVYEGEHAEALLTFNAPFTGTLRYSLTGSAGAEDYSGLTGFVEVSSGQVVSIPFSVAENETVDPLRNLILTLEPAEGTRLGLSSRILITLIDKDARWSGNFVSDGLVLDFELEVINSRTNSHASAVAGPYQLLPEGIHPAEIDHLQADAFAATIGPVQLPAGSSAFGLEAALLLSLEAMAENAAHQLGKDWIVGHGQLEIRYPDRPHLDTRHAGVFQLQRLPPPPPDGKAQLTDW